MTTCLLELVLLRVCVLNLMFPLFFFFFRRVWTVTILFMHMDSLCKRQSAQFTGPTPTLSRKNILKMGPITVFNHSKFILLCYFQFSAFSKISCIRTEPTYFENLTIDSIFFFYILNTHVKICDNQILFTVWCINLFLIRYFELQKLAI